MAASIVRWRDSNGAFKRRTQLREVTGLGPKTFEQAAGFLRNGLFKRLQIHTVPTLHFLYDRTTERAAELSALIREANATRAKED